MESVVRFRFLGLSWKSPRNVQRVRFSLPLITLTSLLRNTGYFQSADFDPLFFFLQGSVVVLVIVIGGSDKRNRSLKLYSRSRMLLKSALKPESNLAGLGSAISVSFSVAPLIIEVKNELNNISFVPFI